LAFPDGTSAIEIAAIGRLNSVFHGSFINYSWSRVILWEAEKSTDCSSDWAEIANEETAMHETIETFPTNGQIEERAYEIFLERGATDGDDLADWLKAEEELKALAQRPADDGPEKPFVAAGGDIDSRPSAGGEVDEEQMARAEELLRELYERSRAIAARAGS
jgi:DUF2934 family protein